MQRAGMITDRDHLDAELMQPERGIGADIAEPLDHAGGIVEIDRELLHHPPGEMCDAAPGGFAAAQRAAGGDRLAGDDLGHGAALVHRIGVHEPGHHLLVGAHVRRHHVGVRPDKGNHLLHVAPRQPLQFALGNRGEIDPHPALGAAIGQTDQRAFPAHPDRQCSDLADIDRRREPGAALGRAEGEVMLHAIALEYRDRAVVAMDRTRDGDRPFRQQNAVALVHRNRQMIGNDAELVHRHVENRTGIDGHRAPPPGRRSGTRNGHLPLAQGFTDDVERRS